MNKWWRIVILILISCVGYSAFQFLGHPSIDITTGSASEAESRTDGFYIGSYIPTRSQFSLKDHSIVPVPNAWIEHAWKPEFNAFLWVKKIPTSGYYLYIPIRWSQSIGSNEIYPFKFSLHLDQQEKQISRYPGIGYESKLGFVVFLDSLPKTIKFTVQQRNSDDSWDDATLVESIEFNRGF